jgi:hypothetical protein
MTKINFFILSILSLLFISCATSPSKQNLIPKDYKVSKDKGVVFGTFSIYKKPKFSTYSLNFRKNNAFQADDEQLNRIFIATNRGGFSVTLIPDFTYNDNIATYYFFFERDPGDYEFSTLNVFSQGYMYSNFYNATISLPFKVEAGQMKYLGEIIFNPNAADFIKVKNEYDRDVQKFSEKYPSTDWKNSIKNDTFEIKVLSR